MKIVPSATDELAVGSMAKACAGGQLSPDRVRNAEEARGGTLHSCCKVGLPEKKVKEKF